jgi:hypothetical protein
LKRKHPKDDELWKQNFKSKIIDLSRFCLSPCQKAIRLIDPDQPGEKTVRQMRFEEAYKQVKKAIDQFLLLELRWSVRQRKFVNGRGRNGA